MFGLDLSFVILVPERKRGIDTGIQETFDSLFDLDLRVKPEGDFYVFDVAQKCHASKPRFYTLKGEQKSPFYSPFNLFSFLSVSICFEKLCRDFLKTPQP